MDEVAARAAAQNVCQALNADVLFFNGEVSQASCRKLIMAGSKRQKFENVFLVLVTPGGDPDAAYKIGRSLQARYKRIAVFIPGWCKSAGTLIAIAANELYVGDHGELGPLDIQLAKADEILEMGSGLAVDAAMKTLEATASKMFLNILLSIRRDTQGMITTRTASDIASTMVSRLLEPIYRQIDPMKIGENSRAMNITRNYGSRLAETSGSLRTRSLDYLVAAYPDHGFVIDRKEATGLFTRVNSPTAAMDRLADALGEAALTPQQRLSGDGSAYIAYLSAEHVSSNRSATDATTGNAPRPKRSGATKRAGNGKSPISP